jgi:hypothetical protein
MLSSNQLFNRKTRVDTGQFPYRKRGIIRRGKVIKGLCGGVHRYAAQSSPRMDAATAEKPVSDTETR